MEPIALVVLLGGVTLTVSLALRVRGERARARAAAVAAAAEEQARAGARCPLCIDAILTEDTILGERRCQSCRGVLLSPERAQQLIYAPRGLTPGALTAVGTGRGVVERCLACSAGMRPVAVDDVVVDVCLRCGALWCDAGELARVTPSGALRA